MQKTKKQDTGQKKQTGWQPSKPQNGKRLGQKCGFFDDFLALTPTFPQNEKRPAVGEAFGVSCRNT
ncbi:hypothetical protein [Shimia sediminis]|uniref:hypothetical protein n=1 Tax=Shimia sediminis TaxID=2497945 RepID=UPI0013E0732C|nr:hypothetical protein [Shimia sediminis]